MVNAKAKGNSFERAICKQLSLWWTEGKRDDVFWRTASSGGRATQRAKIKKTTAGAAGDITYTDAIGKPLLDFFCFEIKRGYTELNLLDLIDSRQAKPLFLQFWDQVKESTQQAGAKEPIVIFKRDKRTTCAIVQRSFLDVFLTEQPCLWLEVISSDEHLTILPLETFLNLICPEWIKGSL